MIFYLVGTSTFSRMETQRYPGATMGKDPTSLMGTDSVNGGVELFYLRLLWVLGGSESFWEGNCCFCMGCLYIILLLKLR